MSMKVTKYITSLLAGTAAAIAAAPTASAADHQSCNGSGSRTVCQSPGNVQITAPPPQVQFHPYGGQAWLLFHHSAGGWDTGTASSWLASYVGGEGVAPMVAQLTDAKTTVSDPRPGM